MNINIQVFFRFLTLNKLQAITLTKEIAGATYVSSSAAEQFIGSITLAESLNNLDDLNIFYVRQQIKLAECDVLIRVKSNTPIHQIQIPTFVNKLLKHIDCAITVEMCKTTS